MLDLQQVAVAYAGHTVVKDISLSLAQGQIGCLVGPSGCGKTTLLRAIAGFEPVIAGSIRLQQQPVSSETVQLAPEQRHVGMVFQDFALFPHLSVADNISFGLLKTSKAVKAAKVKQLTYGRETGFLNRTYKLPSLPNHRHYRGVESRAWHLCICLD